LDRESPASESLRRHQGDPPKENLLTDALRIAIRRFDAFDSAIERQWSDYVASTGSKATMEYESLDLNPLVDRLFTSDGLKNGDIDIAFIVTDWIADAVASDALLDLAPYMASQPVDRYPDQWSPSLTRLQQFGPCIYGLPYHDGPQCLMYRKDYFEDAAERQAFEVLHGTQLEVPTTWDAFEKIARFFNRPESGRFGSVFAGYPDGHNTVYDFCIQLWSRGGELFDEHGRPTISSDAAIEGLDFYRRMMADRSVTPAGLEEIDSVKSGIMFAEGAVSMMVNWFGFAALCEQSDSPTKGKVSVAPVPTSSGSERAALNVYWALAIGSGSRNADLAYEFIRHCMTPEMDKVTTLEGGIGCRLSTWRDPEVNELIPFYNQLPELHRHTRELPRSKALPALSHVIDKAVQEAITSDEATESILRRAQEATNSISLQDALS
jgi:multiple sugar transport system substrate-binding protein